MRPDPLYVAAAAVLVALGALAFEPVVRADAPRAVMAHEPQRPPVCPPHMVVRLETQEAGTWEFALPATCWEA